MPLHQLNYDCFDLIYDQLSPGSKISLLKSMANSKDYHLVFNRLKFNPITIRVYDTSPSNVHQWFAQIDYSLKIPQIVTLIDNLGLSLNLKFDFNDNFSEIDYKSLFNDKYLSNIDSISLKTSKSNQFLFNDCNWNSKIVELLAFDNFSHFSHLSNLKKLHLHYQSKEPVSFPSDFHVDQLIITIDDNIRYDFVKPDQTKFPIGILDLSLPINASKTEMINLIMANCETLQSLDLSILNPMFFDVDYFLPILQSIRKFPNLTKIKTNGYFETSFLEDTSVNEVCMGVLNSRIFRNLQKPDGNNKDIPESDHDMNALDDGLEEKIRIVQDTSPQTRKIQCPDINLFADSTNIKKLTVHFLLIGQREGSQIVNVEFPEMLEELEINYLTTFSRSVTSGSLFIFPKNLKKLTLKNLDMVHPPTIPTSVTYLDLSGNNLSYFPELRKNLKLTHLDLSHNGVKPSPLVTNNIEDGIILENIDYLQNLKYYRIRTREFSNDHVKNLKSLEYLYIQSPEYAPELIFPPNLKSLNIELGDSNTENWKWKLCGDFPTLKLPSSLQDLTIQIPQRRIMGPEDFSYLKDLNVKVLNLIASIDTTEENPLYLSNRLEVFVHKSIVHGILYLKLIPDGSSRLRVLDIPSDLELSNPNLVETMG